MPPIPLFRFTLSLSLSLQFSMLVAIYIHKRQYFQFAMLLDSIEIEINLVQITDFLQEKAIYKAKSVVQKCTREVYSTVQPEIFVAADLGCSSGPNTFMAISEIMEAIHEISCRLSYQPPELMFFLNDLPGNDFNTLFKSLTNYKKKVREENETKHVPYHVAGAPGSFYKRLFPKKSVHFMHSSYSLHWLSQVCSFCTLFFSRRIVYICYICMYNFNLNTN